MHEGLPRIGVALGGGSARGLVHISYIEALDELGLKPAMIAGTSIGALIGAGWAAGLSGADIRQHALKVLGSMRSITSRVWFNPHNGVARAGMKGLSLQFDANQLVESFLPKSVPETFRELRFPLRIVASDFNAWHQVVYDRGHVRPAIAGSIAVPSFFKPVHYRNRVLVDGGVTDPLPLDVASPDTDILIGIDVNGEPNVAGRARAPSTIDMLMGSAQIMMHQLTAQTMAAYPPDIYARPLIGHFGAYEFWKVREILAVGDAEKDRFKRQVAEKVEAFIAGQRRMF